MDKIKEILKEETKGMKKNFDKNMLMFSYNDLREILKKALSEEKVKC
jgi:glutamate-1-semialdehyde aminotransferase